MERINKQTVERECVEHSIHRDICGKLIAVGAEYDGYYNDHMYEIW